MISKCTGMGSSLSLSVPALHPPRRPGSARSTVRSTRSGSVQDRLCTARSRWCSPLLRRRARRCSPRLTPAAGSSCATPRAARRRGSTTHTTALRTTAAAVWAPWPHSSTCGSRTRRGGCATLRRCRGAWRGCSLRLMHRAPSWASTLSVTSRRCPPRHSVSKPTSSSSSPTSRRCGERRLDSCCVRGARLSAGRSLGRLGSTVDGHTESPSGTPVGSKAHLAQTRFRASWTLNWQLPPGSTSRFHSST
mmetsp:Transcript_2480/g.4758  ORF Transcript_2480/g.4758 Transcript_2480/m.4758 type:complete len:249 (-) Transcript_2480:73-819(-)